MMRSIIYMGFVFCIASCNFKNTKIHGPDTSFLEDKIVEEIAKYYHEIYADENILVLETSDSVVDITYFEDASNTESFENYRAHIEIPIKNESDQILYGDLNKDHNDDLIVGVFIEGGGGGGNMYWVDYFVFLKRENNYLLSTVVSNREISDCDNGFIYFEKIEDNRIIGTTSCFVEGDSRCCPSIHYKTVLEFVDESFVLKSEE